MSSRSQSSSTACSTIRSKWQSKSTLTSGRRSIPRIKWRWTSQKAISMVAIARQVTSSKLSHKVCLQAASPAWARVMCTATLARSLSTIYLCFSKSSTTSSLIRSASSISTRFHPCGTSQQPASISFSRGEAITQLSSRQKAYSEPNTKVGILKEKIIFQLI